MGDGSIEFTHLASKDSTRKKKQAGSWKEHKTLTSHSSSRYLANGNYLLCH